MFLLRNDYVVFATVESNGDDICIMDSIGRFSLIHADHLQTLVHDLSGVTSADEDLPLYKIDDVLRQVDELFEDHEHAE